MMSLLELEKGKEGRVVLIQAGSGLINKLDGLGIRPGVRVKKKSVSLVESPILISVGRTQIAIGRGMASKIMVETGKK